VAGKKQPPKKLHARDFAALSAFLRGYLHQDFRDDYATPDAALAAYCTEASHDEVHALGAEWEKFLAITTAIPFAETRTFFCDELGSGWHPQSREKLESLLTVLKNAAS
jgi:CdiI immunity protein